MKLVVVGGSGYLGSEIIQAADDTDVKVYGTYHEHQGPGLVYFNLADEDSWDNIGKIEPDLLVWAAKRYFLDLPRFSHFINKIQSLGSRVIYVSSDIINCNEALNAENDLGNYARHKRAEHQLVDEQFGEQTVITGPIYGENSAGRLDGRSRRLVELAGQPQEYWDNVIKTFVSVRGLACTIVAKRHQTSPQDAYIGPGSRESYYQFHLRRATELGLPTENITASQLDTQEAQKRGICMDTSYADEKSRLWWPEQEISLRNN